MSLIILAASASLLFASEREGPLANWTVAASAPATSEARNEVRLEGSRLLWNGSEVSEKLIREYLKIVRQMNPQPPTILTSGAGIPEPRLQRARKLIDDALQCRPTTCVEVTSPKP